MSGSRVACLPHLACPCALHLSYPSAGGHFPHPHVLPEGVLSGPSSWEQRVMVCVWPASL